MLDRRASIIFLFFLLCEHYDIPFSVSRNERKKQEMIPMISAKEGNKKSKHGAKNEKHFHIFFLLSYEGRKFSPRTLENSRALHAKVT